MAMISHVFVGVQDFDRACEFYASVLPLLNWIPRFRDEGEGWAGWQPADGEERPLFLVGRPFNGEAATPGNGQMVALQAASRAIVETVYATALANGGSCEGRPGLRPHYHAHYYGAYFRDTEGNKLCVCCHRPED